MSVTIYRECKCGENAHDLTDRQSPSGFPVYACRNCGRKRFLRPAPNGSLRACAQCGRILRANYRGVMPRHRPPERLLPCVGSGYEGKVV